MALLANQMMDARILSSMNGRVELSQFLRVSNQSIVTQVNSAQEDNRKNRKYPCPLCGKRFRFNSILSLHMRTHTGEKPFKCPYCDHRAAQKGNLKIHLRTHKQGLLGKGRGRIREENRLLHELEERAILRDRQMRATHVSQQQKSNLPQLKNPSLSPTVSMPSQFLTTSGAAENQPHTSASPKVTTAHDEPNQPQPTGFRCSFCKGKFRKQQELERHIRILHKPYKCTLCEFAASHEEELIGHVEMTHITADAGSSQKPAIGPDDKGKAVGEFPCEVCGQTFSQAWFLKGHMRKHKDSFEHCCQICGRRFKEPWFLKNHMKVHLNKLAAKGNLPAEHDSTGNPTQDHQSNLYSQYISRIHNRFLMSERADHPDYNQILNTAGVDMKVREMLGRMISSSLGPLTDAESSSLLGLNHLQPPLSSASLEYLQKVMSNRDTFNGSSSLYPGWQIMTPGLPVEQPMFPSKDRQQCSPYLSERCLPADDGKTGLIDPDAKAAVSRPGSTDSVSHHEPAETGNSHSGSGLDHHPESASPAAGENVYRCPLSSDYTPASLGFHLERYHFPHWQSSRDLSSPLQPSGSSSSSSPNAKLRPRSGEDWGPAAGHYLSLENLSEPPLLVSKPPDLADKDASSSAPTRKSQYEPLDLSVRPESGPSHSPMSSAALAQMSGVFGNGLSSSISRRLPGYPGSAAELGAKPAYQRDLSARGADDETGGSASHDGEFETSEQGREEESEEAAKWPVRQNNVTEELEHAGADFPGQEKPGQWGRGVAEAPVSSLDNLTPGHGDALRYQGGLLSFLRSQGSLSGANKASLNGGGKLDKDVASARKPFQCRYCPYSASQKGNLKTHVLCVHRKPFDNSLYPDRRLRRSHAPQRTPRLPPGVTGDSRVPGRDQIGMTSLCGT